MAAHDDRFELQLVALFHAEAQDVRLPPQTWQAIAPRMGEPDRPPVLSKVMGWFPLTRPGNPMNVRYVASAVSVSLAVLATLLFVLLLNDDRDGEGGPAPAASPTVPVEPTEDSALAACGGPVESDGTGPRAATYSYPDYDGFLWVLPDGTDRHVTADDIRAVDPRSDSSTVIRIVHWSDPAVSPDHARAAAIVQRRYSGVPEGHHILVFSNEVEPVSAVYEFPEEWKQPLIGLKWLPESGCLSVLAFNPEEGQYLYLMDGDAGIVASFEPKLARGNVLDGAGGGWIMLDRTNTFSVHEVELFHPSDPSSGTVVSAGAVLPDLPGLTGAGEMTAEELAIKLLTGEARTLPLRSD